MKAVLALEDGSIFDGTAIGAPGSATGEVVFNTSMTGYQEILTDPSYAGEIVCMTYPLIGNYGVSLEDFESKRPHVRGFIVKELCRIPSNWRSAETLEAFLSRHRITGMEGVDTRALTKVLRNHGTMRGVISTEDRPTEALIEMAKNAPMLSGQQFCKSVSTDRAYTLHGDGKRMAVLDMGCKENIVRCLLAEDCGVTVLPCDAKADAILAGGFDGLVISNGPGDPKDNMYAVETLRALIGRLPMFGICLGHQLLGLAFGGDTYKLKFGHRGGNHPVKDLATGRVYITSQNHGFAVAEESLPDEVRVSHKNLNDGTVEGLEHKSFPVLSVQYHPEASPGPRDSRYLFPAFLELCQ